MKTVETIEEENTIVVDDQYDRVTYNFYPRNKEIEISRSVKDDCFFSNDTVEYRISTSPIEIYMRTLESSNEPPLEYSIKDGVVLESEIDREGFEFFPDRIKNLKKEVEWNKVPLFANYEVNLYILFKHPEIVSKEEYRRFLRQSIERIKMGVLKVGQYLKEDTHGLKILTGEYGKSIWYPNSDAEKNESEKHWELSEEKRGASAYGKKIVYAEEFNKTLFNEDSSRYVGMAEYEFNQSTELVEYLEKLLNKKENHQAIQPAEKISKTKGFIISLLLTLLISWVLSWFVDVNPFLIFVLVQAVSFIQAIIGGRIEDFLNK